MDTAQVFLAMIAGFLFAGWSVSHDASWLKYYEQMMLKYCVTNR